ncbi:MAG: phosphatase PAP2 family protein [Clostridia bacterium]|nr:phosphatase PAP2 family protein [Clostridia bacterium]
MVPYFPDVIQTWDVNVLNWIQEHICNPVLDAIFPIITLFGEKGLFLIAVAVLFLCFKKARKTGIMMGAALLLGLIIGNGILKNVFMRVRPYELEGALRNAEQLLSHAPTDPSFPSGHSLACFECATVLMYRDKRFGIPALVLAVAVALSRIYLYIHFPTDVIAGAILGIIIGVLAIVIVNSVLKLLENKKGIHLD